MPSTPIKMGFQRNDYSRFSFGKKRKDLHLPEQNHGLLKDATDARNRSGFINYGQDDQMQICAYKRNPFKYALTWFFIVITAGILRLVYHWFPHWLLLSTSSKCAYDQAQTILITECYKNKHKTYHVKPLKILTPDKIKEIEKDLEIEDPIKLSVHFGEGIFRRVERVTIFNCKKVTYVLDEEHGEFVKLRGLDTGGVRSETLHASEGLTRQEQAIRRLVYGTNEIVVPVKTITNLLFLEVLNPFYIFQIWSFILWMSDNYYYYAMAILFMSAGSVITAVHQTRKNQRNLLSTVHSSDVATIVRNKPDESGDTQKITETISTELLVPGDVLEIPQHGCIMHCDAVLLTGNCIVNESMLTGESVPVTKTSLPSTPGILYDAREHSRHTLFCGTHVIQTRYYGGEKVLAVVIRTGFNTSKGGLVRSILYPPPVDFRFEKDSYRFVVLLAGIASIGFVYTIITKAMRGVSTRDIILEALDLITIVVPPALPAAMTVGRLYAQKRLEKQNIYCISPRTINVSGSIDCVCFDKTGTLTEDGLDMLCVVPIQDRYFRIPIRNVSAMQRDTFLYGLASCHSLTIIDKQLTGDPLDLKMFESTSWIMEEHDTSDNTKFNMIFPTVLRPPPSSTNTDESDELQIGIMKEFPFSSSSQRMGVIVRRLSGQHFEYYCKGSPEMLLNFCKPESVPEDFLNVLESYTQKGYRVIAMAHRELNKMSYAKIHRAQRDVLEKDMSLLGLIVLENRLKPDSAPVIHVLNRAHIRTIMVTGDNMLTAISVARECGIITSNQSVISINVDASGTGIYYTLATTGSKVAVLTNGCAGNDNSITDSASIVSLDTVESAVANTVDDSESPVRPTSIFNNYRFALTGKSWSVVRDYYPELLPRIVTRGTVYSRMSPEQKQQLVEELQGLGYYVAMCGDGANDCGALKAAHAGVSLSDAESSVASPFTSKNPNIQCIPSIIREGRAALVTSFGIFKYMASYSLCQFVSVMILYSIDSNLTDIQFLYIDLFIISIFAFFFGKTEAYSGKLVKETPLTSLVSSSPIASLILQMILVMIFQIVAFEHIQAQPWFVPFNVTIAEADGEEHPGCLENYAVFAVSSFQYVILAVVFSKGKPYRAPIFTNYGLLLSALGITAFSAYLIIYPFDFLRDQFQLILPPEMEFRLLLMIYPIIHFVLAVLIEVLIIEHLVFKKLRFRFHRIDKSKRKYLAIERDLLKDSKWPMLTSDYRGTPSPRSETPTPICTAEIVVEKDNAFSKNHVLNNLFDGNDTRASEVKLDPSLLTNRNSNVFSCDNLDTRVRTSIQRPVVGSVPNVRFDTSIYIEDDRVQSVMEMNNIQKR